MQTSARPYGERASIAKIQFYFPAAQLVRLGDSDGTESRGGRPGRRGGRRQRRARRRYIRLTAQRGKIRKEERCGKRTGEPASSGEESTRGASIKTRLKIELLTRVPPPGISIIRKILPSFPYPRTDRKYEYSPESWPIRLTLLYVLLLCAISFYFSSLCNFYRAILPSGRSLVALGVAMIKLLFCLWFKSSRPASILLSLRLCQS